MDTAIPSSVVGLEKPAASTFMVGFTYPEDESSLLFRNLGINLPEHTYKIKETVPIQLPN